MRLPTCMVLQRGMPKQALGATQTQLQHMQPLRGCEGGVEAMLAMLQGKVLRCGMSEEALGCAQAGMQEMMIKTWLLLSFCKLTLLICFVEGCVGCVCWLLVVRRCC